MGKRYIARVTVDEVVEGTKNTDRHRDNSTPDSVQQSGITVRANSFEKLAKKVNAAMTAIALEDD